LTPKNGVVLGEPSRKPGVQTPVLSKQRGMEEGRKAGRKEGKKEGRARFLEKGAFV
jgi:hypothetical protein